MATILLVGVLGLSEARAQESCEIADFGWSYVFGSEFGDGAWSIALDDQEQVILAATAEEELGESRVIVQKLDHTTTPIWTSDMTSSQGIGIKCTTRNELITCAGGFAGTMTTGVSGHSSNGNSDAYVAVLDQNGLFQWSHSWGGAEQDTSTHVAATADGNVLVVGYFRGTVDLDPTGGVNEYSSPDHWSSFLSRFSSTGEYDSSIVFDAGQLFFILNIAVDSLGDIVLVGRFTGSVDFDPTGGMDVRTSSGSQDNGFITKLGADGSYHWTHVIASTEYTTINRLHLDAEDSIAIAGQFRGTIDFDPSGETAFHTEAYTSLFVAKFDSAGLYDWTFVAPSEENSWAFAYNLDSDSHGGVVLGGAFAGTVIFDGEAHTPNGDISTWEDFFITRLRNDGSHSWTLSSGGVVYDAVFDLAVKSNDDILACGKFDGVSDLDPTDGSDSHVSMGSDDGFLIMLEQAFPNCLCLEADFDGDGEVGPSDLAILLTFWGTDDPPFGDLNGDGEVDPIDLATLLGNWGPCA